MAPGNRRSSTPSSSQTAPNPNASSSTQGATSRAPSSTGSTTTRRTPRGLAKNNFLTKYLRVANNQKPRIEILEGMARPVGKWSKEFVTEVGIICCAHAPLACRDWSKVEKEDRIQLHLRILEKFDIDLDLHHVKKAVDRYMGQRFKDYRCRMHKHYQKSSTEEQGRRNPYKGLSQEIWQKVCDNFEDEEFKRNPENQNELGRIELYRLTYSKGDKWTSSKAEEYYKEMLEIQSRPVVEGSIPPTEDAICNEVLGTRPGYIKGLGHGVLTSLSSSCSQSEVTAATRRAEAAEKRNEELLTQIPDQGKMLEELQVWKTTMVAQWDSFMSRQNGGSTQ